jgi:hypothetical protein
MAWTQSDLDKLDALIASGAKETRFQAGDSSRSVMLHSLRDMLALRDRMASEIATVSGVQTGSATLASHSRD